MSVPQSYIPDLDSPEVYNFLQDKGNPGPWDAPISTKAGYSLSSQQKRPVGSFDQITPGVPLQLFWAVQEWYEVIEGRNPGQVVGGFDVVVPWAQLVRVHISAVLQVKDATPTPSVQQIEMAFSGYQYPRDGDPNDYVAIKLGENPAISRSMFSVDYTYTLERVGVAVSYEQQKRALLAVYEDHGNGSVTPGLGLPPVGLNENGYFKRREIQARRIHTESIGKIPTKARDPIHEVENPNIAPSVVIEDIVRREGDKLDCGLDFDKNEWKILTLLQYPEFKVEWRNHSFEIGCGVWIVISLPALQIRTSQLNLWAYTRSPKNLGALVSHVIETCAWHAALSGAVVGVVLGNFIAALQAFRAVFTECLKDKLDQFIQCMIPGLVLITEVKAGDDWHDV